MAVDGVEDSPVRAARYAFEPQAHRAQLVAIVREVAAAIAAGESAPLPNARLHTILRRHPRDGRGFFSRSQIIAGFREFGGEAGVAVDERTFVEHLQLRPVRTQSGVTPITVLSKPFPCPGKCVFCPNDVRMPKSYLSEEPGAQRAESNGFDPYLQTYNRLRALRAIGHNTDKVELIVLGGTWSFYPEDYQVWFVRRCFDAMNDFGAGVDGRAVAEADRVDLTGVPRTVDGRDVDVSYNRIVRKHFRSDVGSAQDPAWDSLLAAHLENEHAACRCVGLVLETRPDHVSPAEVLRLRRLGATKVQLGLQSLSDRVLHLNQRGHDVAQAREAMHLLRDAGFKVLAHYMPNLLGSSPAEDIEDFRRLFDDIAIRPDELKVYPCSLVESAELMRHYESGQWRPYARDELLGVLRAALESTPRYCRLSRVIRDISSKDIVAGNRESNMREVAERALDAEDSPRIDIRARELRHDRFDHAALSMRRTEYPTAHTDEVFLEFVLPDDRLAGFCRLSLPRDGRSMPELAQSAVVRELHVYGTSLALGAAAGVSPQHRGLGRRLLEAAAEVARAAGCCDLAVISAVGTRAYYRRAGFQDGPLYQHLNLKKSE